MNIDFRCQLKKKFDTAYLNITAFDILYKVVLRLLRLKHLASTNLRNKARKTCYHILTNAQATFMWHIFGIHAVAGDGAIKEFFLQLLRQQLQLPLHCRKL